MGPEQTLAWCCQSNEALRASESMSSAADLFGPGCDTENAQLGAGWMRLITAAPFATAIFDAQLGAVSPTATRLQAGAVSPNPTGVYPMTARHSARAAERLSR